MLRQAKARGVRVTAEVTPHHLLLTDELAASYDPVYKVNPPLRTAADVAALREALVEGVIDVVATDHAPHAVEDKECEWAYARPGMVGLETALPVGALASLGEQWDLIAERMSRAPARIAGLAGHGSDLAAGAPANLTLVDPAARRVVDPAELASRSRNTPYAGMTLPGRIVATFLRGEPTVLDGKASRSDSAAAILVLEDGRTFHGEAYGAVGETFGEAVFTTGMTGYQETLTDPSYHRQVVVQTAPQIGNTGVNDEDDESDRIWVAGYVVRDPARRPSNWRSTGDAGRPAGGRGHRRDQRHRHPGADPAPARARRDAGRRLQRRPRSRSRCCARVRGAAADGRRRPVRRGDHRRRVHGRGRRRAPLHGRRARPGHQAQRRPAAGRARRHHARLPGHRPRIEDLLAVGPDAVFFSPGPGDPATADHPVALAREVLRRRVPLFGICFGSQILGRALGFGTYKLGYGHRGINQPVLDRTTGKVEVTRTTTASRWTPR